MNRRNPQHRLEKVDLPTETPLASDLEWVLHSRQVGPEVVLETLLSTYHERLLPVALGLLGSVNLARQTLAGIFATAALEARRYRGGGDMDAWFYGIAWKKLVDAAVRPRAGAGLTRLGEPLSGGECFRGLSAWHQIAFCMHLLGGLDGRQMSAAAGITEDAANLLVWQARRRMAACDLEQAAIAWLQTRVDQLRPGQGEQEACRLLALEHLERRRRWPARLGEAPALLLVVFLAVAALWGAGRFLAEPGAPPPAPMILPSITPEPTRRPSSTPLQALIYQTSTPTARPTATPTPSGVFYQSNSSQRFDAIAGMLRVSEADLRRLNRIPPGSEIYMGQPLLIPGKLDEGGLPQATPVTPFTATLQIRADQIGQDVRDDLHGSGATSSNVWVDALLLTRTPRDGQTAQLAWRMQLWYSGSQVLLIGGPAGSDPAEVLLGGNQDTYVARPGLGNLWFESINNWYGDGLPMDARLLLGANLLLSNSLDFSTGQMILLGEDRLLDRPVWLVEERDPDGKPVMRRWIDQRTGLTLRLRWVSELPMDIFSLGIRGNVPDEIVVQAVAFDTDFPQELFNPGLPWRGGYAAGPGGEPIPASAPPLVWVVPPGAAGFKSQPPPAGFDSSSQPLALLHRFDSAAPLAETEIYAGGYLLGAVPLGDPWHQWCRRSPDGTWLAYLEPGSWYNDFPIAASGPYWFSLDDPAQVHNAFPEADRVSGYFAISPDSKRLAFWGCGRPEDDCGIYLRDVDENRLNLLLPSPAPAGYFAFSPDGLYLAAASQEGDLLVVRTNDGGVVYREPYTPGDAALPAGAPVLEWGVAYPPLMLDWSTCALR